MSYVSALIKKNLSSLLSLTATNDKVSYFSYVVNELSRRLQDGEDKMLKNRQDFRVKNTDWVISWDSITLKRL